MEYTTRFYDFKEKNNFDKVVKPDNAAIDEIGIIYAPSDDINTPPAAIAGYHVNARFKGEVPVEWEPYRIYPKTPSRDFF